MKDKIDGEEELNELFKSILGTNVKVKDNIKVTEQLLFVNTIQKLENSHKLEESLFGDYGISISQITDPLWEIIGNDFNNDDKYFHHKLIELPRSPAGHFQPRSGNF